MLDQHRITTRTSRPGTEPGKSPALESLLRGESGPGPERLPATLFEAKAIASLVENGTVAVFRSCVRFTVVELNARAPGPVIAPAAWANVPPDTTTVSPLVMLIEPLLVKLGAVPVWRIVNFAPTLIVPPLVWAADALFRVSGWLIVSVPAFCNTAFRDRVPRVPTFATMSTGVRHSVVKQGGRLRRPSTLAQ